MSLIDLNLLASSVGRGVVIIVGTTCKPSDEHLGRGVQACNLLRTIQA